MKSKLKLFVGFIDDSLHSKSHIAVKEWFPTQPAVDSFEFFCQSLNPWRMENSGLHIPVSPFLQCQELSIKTTRGEGFGLTIQGGVDKPPGNPEDEQDDGIFISHVGDTVQTSSLKPSKITFLKLTREHACSSSFPFAQHYFRGFHAALWVGGINLHVSLHSFYGKMITSQLKQILFQSSCWTKIPHFQPPLMMTLMHANLGFFPKQKEFAMKVLCWLAKSSDLHEAGCRGALSEHSTSEGLYFSTTPGTVAGHLCGQACLCPAQDLF